MFSRTCPVDVVYNTKLYSRKFKAKTRMIRRGLLIEYALKPGRLDYLKMLALALTTKVRHDYDFQIKVADFVCAYKATKTRNAGKNSISVRQEFKVYDEFNFTDYIRSNYLKRKAMFK